MRTKILVALCCVLCAISVAHAKSGVHLSDIRMGEVVGLRNLATVAADGTAGGESYTSTSGTIPEQADRLPCRKDLVFGVEFHVSSPAKHTRLRVEWQHPQMISEDGKPWTEQYYYGDFKDQTTARAWYRLEKEYELVKGTWRVRIRDGNDTLLEKVFTLY